jgi:competence protein ComEC
MVIDIRGRPANLCNSRINRERGNAMNRTSLSVIAIILALGTSGSALAQGNPAPRAQSGKLSMYWVDTEGGAATLIVSPSGESLLIDTGFPDGDRDAKRIYSAARQAGLDHIDHLVISHWHRDHEGGLAAFAKMMPISKFYDHGDTVSPEDQGRLDDYKAVAGNKRVIVSLATRFR